MDQLHTWLMSMAGDAEPWASYAKYLPKLLDGAGLTLQLVVVSGLIGVCLAIPMALMRVAKSPWVWGLPYAYIFFFRGTPLLVQIFLVYYGLSQFEAIRDLGWLWDEVLSQPYWCAIIAFTLNTTAYIAELFRGAIQSVPRGEVEAAQAIGMNRYQQYRHIILPRAFGIILPAYGNEVILMLKGSALASTITLLDLTGMTRNVIARTYMSMEFFLLAGALYLLIAGAIILLFRGLEHLYSAQHRQPRLAAKGLDPQLRDQHLDDPS
ncbi:ABC transporter permease [Terasakiispira papahanaumokuakeensis]